MTISGQYLTYTEYKSLGGTLDEMPFSILELEARKNIDKYTNNRLVELATQVDEVKICCYRLVNMLSSYQNMETQNRAIASESTDGYSISYSGANSSYVDAKTKDKRDIINTYLAGCKLDDGTPYLYRGIK